MSDFQSTTPGAGWHPDPSGRHELRYWDGNAWTDHVSDQGRTGTDSASAPPGTSARDAAHIPYGDESADKVMRQVEKRGGAPATAGSTGSIFDEPVLVVNQKAKLIEINNEYAVYDANGRQIGAVRQVGQSTARKILRVVSSVDQFLTQKLQVCDMHGRVHLDLVRPAKIMKSTVVVNSPERGEIGKIVQENVIGKIHFGLEVGGRRIGSINAENWRAWNFNIQDEHGTEVARITKTWGGVMKAAFTTADNYVVHIHNPLAEPLRSMVIAAALCVDTALKQDDRSGGIGISFGG